MLMNPFLSRLMTYYEVHKLSRSGLSIRKISELLELNWRTVKRLLSFEDDRDYQHYLQTFSQKEKLLEPYTDFVRNNLKQFRDTSAAQMHDWLKEHYPDFPSVSAKTVFNFVHWVRQQYNLPHSDTLRSYELVEETPYGIQAQVDFGQYNLRDTQGGRVKVYFFILVLSRSRYKYLHFSFQPFTSRTAIDAHEKAFEFIGGMPDTLVYDQDRVFMVDENKGDLILTDAFRNYSKHRGFKLHFCRKADPQSKGKVENVVKYTKQNFLYNRPFLDIDVLNSEALAWLYRTANELPHSFTQKRPAAEWIIERAFLQPIYTPQTPLPSTQAYTVRKDNSFSYKGNLYSLPYDTYKGRGTKIELRQQDGQLLIFNPQQKELCRHTIVTGVGQKVINNDHRRDKNHGLRELEEQFCKLTEETEKAKALIAAIRQDKPRYVRDQLLMLLQIARTTSLEVIKASLIYCQEHPIAGAADFKAIVEHLQRSAEQEQIMTLGRNPLNNQMPDQALIQPFTSSITDYDMF